MRFIFEVQRQFNIGKSIIVIYIIKVKDKNYMIISIDTEKNIWKKNAPFFYDKTLKQIDDKRNISQHN